ncbi:MAG: hypothetical protein M3Y59_18275 [Myxococcota bacterium]|nr:hypothetical protein [Myxococcota bacterium]
MRPSPLLCCLAVLVLAGCPRRTVDPLDNPKGLAPIQVTLQHQDSGSNRWGVVYQFRQPAVEAIFEREDYPYRDRWRVISPAEAQVVLQEGTTRVSTPGTEASFDTLVLEIPEDELPPTGGHPLFVRFADGSRLVFTGHLNLVPCRANGCEGAVALSQRLQVPLVFQFLPLPGERAIIGGKVFSESGWWLSTGTGTYAYFGKTQPVVKEHFIGVIDAGLPVWLRERTETLLPLLFDVYRARTGKALAAPPVVFLSFGEPTLEGGITLSGGTLPGTLQMRIGLGEQDVAARAARVEHQLFRFAAHQAGHLWMGQLYRPQSAAEEWLQESATDAFALRALRQLDLIDAASAQTELSLAVSRCAAEASASAALLGSHQVDDCAAAVTLFSEAAIRQKQPTRDLFSLWRNVFERATDGRYSSDQYFSALGELAGSDAEARARALASPGTRTSELLLSSLTQAGVELKRGTEAPAEFNRYLGELALRRVLQQSCAPTSPGSSAVEASSCDRIRDPSRVLQLAGRRITEGPSVYAEVRRLCAEKSSVPVLISESTEGPIQLPCSVAIPPAPEFLQVHYRLPVPNKAPTPVP